MLAVLLGLAGTALSDLSLLLGCAIALGTLAGSWILAKHRAGQVRAGLVDMAWWVDIPTRTQGAVVPDMELQLHITVKNRSSLSLGAATFEMLTGPGLDVIPVTVPLAPATSISAHSTVTPLAVGRWLVHGAVATFHGPAGLFAWEAYFPTPQPIRVLPAAMVLRSSLLPPGEERDPSGKRRSRRIGPGGDLREIRQYRPGDPFKLMAWKHTARKGSPMVRQLEHPARGRLHLILDMSPSMRDGPVGASKLDCAIQAIADHASRAAREGTPFGYMAVDMEVYHELPQDEGPRHLSRLLVLLSELHSVVEEGFTDSTDQEVVEALGRYLLYQQGLDIRARPEDPRAVMGTKAAYLQPLLEQWATDCLADWRRTHRDRDLSTRVPVATSPFMAALRQCCRIRGIPLPYRSGGLPEKKTGGLGAALTQIAVTRTHMCIILVTDLQQLSITGPLEAALRLTRRRGHDLQVLCPYAPNLHSRPRGPLQGTLFDLQARREWLSIESNIQTLAKMGFFVHFLDRKGKTLRGGSLSFGRAAHGTPLHPGYPGRL